MSRIRVTYGNWPGLIVGYAPSADGTHAVIVCNGELVEQRLSEVTLVEEDLPKSLRRRKKKPRLKTYGYNVTGIKGGEPAA